MGISWQQLLILAVIVALIFGTKRLRNVGSDLGSAIKGFKKGLNEEEEEPKLEADPPLEQSTAKNQASESAERSSAD